MKRKLLLFILASSSLTLADIAQAKTLPSNGGPDNGWYVVANGGLNMPNAKSATDPSGANLKGQYHTGYSLEGALGRWYQSFAVEAEADYMYSGLKGLQTAGNSIANNGHTSVTAGMLNGYYGFRNSSDFVPYVGLGAGIASIKNQWHSSQSAVSLSGTDNVFAYQGIVGVGYHFAPNWIASVDYRYFSTAKGNFNTTDSSGQAGKSSMRFTTNLVNLGIAYHF